MLNIQNRIAVNSLGNGALGSFSIDHSFLFDGVDEHFKIPQAQITDVISGADATATISMLINPSAIGSGEYLFTRRGGGGANFLFEFRLNLTNSIRFNYRNATDTTTDVLNSTTGLLSTGNWYFISVVLEGSSSKVYVNAVDRTSSNGILDGKTYGTGTTSFYETNSFNNGSAGGYNGYISHQSIIGLALDQTQQTAFYNGGEPLNPITEYGNDCVWFGNPDDSGSTAQFAMVDSTNSVTSTSVNMEDADKTTTTPY